MKSDDDVVSAFIYLQLCTYATGNNNEPLEKLTPLLSGSFGIVSRIVLHQALGNIYRSAADWHSSKIHFKEAIHLAKDNGYVCRAVECKAELGRAYRSSGCHSKALKHQEKLLKFATSRGDTFGIASACGYIGFTYYSMGRQYYSEAAKYLYSRLLLSNDELDDVAGYRWCLNNLGKVYLELKEHDLCIKLFSESAKIAKELGNMLGLGTAYGNLGSACRAVDKHHEAIDYHKQYLEIAEGNSDTGGVAIMQRELILDHLYLYSCQTAEDKKDVFLNQAQSYALEALKTSLVVRSRLGKEDDMLKIGNFEHNQAKIYSLLLFILVQQKQHEASLVISELGRAHALADRMREKFKLNSRFFSNVLGILGSDNKICISAISAVSEKIGELMEESNSHMLLYSMLENPLNKEHLLYMWHVHKVKEGIEVHFKESIAGSSNCVPNHSLFDEDYFSDLKLEIGLEEPMPEEFDKSHIKLDSGQNMSAADVPRDIVRRKNPRPATNNCAKKDILEELYDVLIYPMDEYMHVAASQTSKLIIIPHGPLFHVPFCALKKGEKHLVERFIICLCPSLCILDIGLQREKEWSKLSSSKEPVKVLAVGNPTMPLSEISQLGGSESEVKSIASLLNNTKLLCGHDATKNEVMAGFSKYPVVHLATHAITESSLSDILVSKVSSSKFSPYDVGDYAVKGAIILAKSDANCSGVLTSSEIEQLDLYPSNELVVLSCCNTARGTVTGDGILGLSRSLMCAGVMSMIVTLWRIEDNSTALLMKHFYQLYRESRDAPAALCDSMQYLIRLGYGCKKWAAFCCIGVKHSYNNNK